MYISSNKFRKDWTVTLDYLRDTVFDCKKQTYYKEYKIFKNRLLDPAVKEVSEKTDCQVTYTPIRKGKKIVEIRLSVIEKIIDVTAETVGLPQNNNDEYDIAKYGSENLAILADALNNEFSKSEMERISMILTRISVLDGKFAGKEGSGIWKEYRYLKEKYSILNYMEEIKKQKKDSPIKNRFKYFTCILEDDAIAPAAN